GTKKLSSGGRHDSKSAESGFASGICKLERRHGEVRLPGEACRNRFWRFDERFCGWVVGQERCDWRRSRGVRPARSRGAKKLQELLACADGEPAVRVGDNVGVDVVAQVKPNCDCLRARRLRVVIGRSWNSGR